MWICNFRDGLKWVKEKVLGSIDQIIFKVQLSQVTWTRHMAQIKKCKKDSFSGCPLSLHPDPGAAISAKSEKKTALIIEGK